MTTSVLASPPWHDGGSPGGWHGGFFPLFPLLLVAALATALVLGVRRSRYALRVLAERYARGEIDDAEYRERRDVLRRRR